MINDTLPRCPRCLKDDLYITYHDTERWVPVYDDRKQFEFLILEWAQAGLSRHTVLKKREGYRIAFADRDATIVAKYDHHKIEELMHNPNIIRNRAKITATITNAQVFLDIQQAFWSFSSYIRWFSNNQIIDNQLSSIADCPSTSPLSDTISKDLKNRGMKFVWSTIIYAHLQATGQINDHLVSCFRYTIVWNLLK